MIRRDHRGTTIETRSSIPYYPTVVTTGSKDPNNEVLGLKIPLIL